MPPERAGPPSWSRVSISIFDLDSGDTWIALFEDITERHAVDAALRQSQDVTQALLNAIPDAIMLAEPHGRVLAANNRMAERLGTSVSQLVGQIGYDFLPGDVARSRKVVVDDAIRSRTTAVARDTRAGRVLENRITPVFNQIGRVTSVAIISRDVTKTHEQDQRLRLITDSVPAAIAHFDVHGRYTFVNRVYRQWFGGSAKLIIGRHLQEVIGAAYRTAAPHVETVLAGQPIHFENEVRAADGQFRSIEVSYVPDYTEEKSVRGFFALGRRITIRAKEDAGFLQYAVEDTGPGIPFDVANKMFDPFFTTKQVGRGTGLGLSLSHGIVEEHGGTVRYEAVTGGGARFLLRIPVAADDEPSKLSTDPLGTIGEGRRGCVLVVDDEEFLRTFFQRALRRAGLDVATATSGNDALAKLEGKSVEVVLMDLKMPGMSGASKPASRSLCAGRERA